MQRGWQSLGDKRRVCDASSWPCYGWSLIWLLVFEANQVQRLARLPGTTRDLFNVWRLKAPRLHVTCHLPSRAGSVRGPCGVPGPTSSSRRAHLDSLIMSFTLFHFCTKKSKHTPTCTRCGPRCFDREQK